MISIFMKSSSPELCYELKVGWAEEFDSKFLKISCECQAADKIKAERDQSARGAFSVW